ncbi:unnamed protein product [Psylliodes chrysocephalus]|uniref:Uncharacterized protein n=1 Tax=Psylliodes chrysocephalus TaxID=3402493 RepID=A0A9P0D0D3_9CUCU|nr:unnamed protein product [Psylliodes chrysocephala]
MLSQLKRSIPDLRLHKTHQPLIAQSTPPSSHRIRTIRRQSSIGAYHHQDPTPTTAHHQTASLQTQHITGPLSSSTSYYTNSPSPPHVGDANGTQVQETLVPLDSAIHIQHSTMDSHSDNLVISRSLLEHINNKLDHLSKRVTSLESTLATDVKTILSLLQAHQQPSSSEVSTVKQEMPEYENLAIDPCRTRYTFQRSVSEPKPISRNHSQVLHRFASFNKAFDFEKGIEPSWAECLLPKDKEKEEKTAPIAKLESLDELDLESPLGSPKKSKK